MGWVGMGHHVLGLHGTAYAGFELDGICHVGMGRHGMAYSGLE